MKTRGSEATEDDDGSTDDENIEDARIVWREGGNKLAEMMTTLW